MKWMNLTIAILDFGVRLYGGSEPSKHLSKCLLWCEKLNKSNLIWIFLWRLKISEAVCKRDWHNVRSYLFSMCKNFGLSVQWPLMTRQRDVVVVRTALTAAMVVPSTMFKVYDPPNSETLVSKLFQNFPVINMTWEAVHIKFLIRKLVFTIIPIAHEGSNILISHLFRMIVWTLGCTFSQEPVIIWPESKPLYSAQV